MRSCKAKNFLPYICFLVISFALAMYQASKPPRAAQAWINVLDFVGYVIFFVAIFFVAHALYIMIVSIHSSKEYARFHIMTISELLEQTSSATESHFRNVLYRLRYLPVSYVRSKAEFKIIYVLFRDTYVMILSNIPPPPVPNTLCPLIVFLLFSSFSLHMQVLVT